MSIVSSSEIISILGVSSYTSEIEAIHLGIESMIKNECGKTFESTVVIELYDGGGGYYRLPLKQIPVTAVSRVSTNFEYVIKITSSTPSTSASVKVDSISVTLDIDGSIDILPIATYTTLSSLVTAINALSAKGWSASIVDSIYNSKKTSKLISRQINITAFDESSSYNYLYMGEPIDFIFIPDTNSIEAYFPLGTQNISVNYTAGSTPADIKATILTLTKSTYDRFYNSADGIKRFTIGDITMEYYDAIENIPLIKNTIYSNKKVTI